MCGRGRRTRQTPLAGPRDIVLEDVVRDDHPLRHDPDKLAHALLRLYESRRRPRAKWRGTRCRTSAYTAPTQMHMAFQIVQILLAIVMIGRDSVADARVGLRCFRLVGQLHLPHAAGVRTNAVRIQQSVVVGTKRVSLPYLYEVLSGLSVAAM